MIASIKTKLFKLTKTLLGEGMSAGKIFLL